MTNANTNIKFNTLTNPSLKKDFAYNSQGGVTIAHAIVKQYLSVTKHPLSKNEHVFIKMILEDNNNNNNNNESDTCLTQVPSNKFKLLWQGTQSQILNLNCGRFNINETHDDDMEDKNTAPFKNLQR